MRIEVSDINLKKVEYQEITCKSALVKSKLPDADFVVNPYIGCDFACRYCYAAFMGRFVKKKRDEWGNYVYAKVNIIEVLRKELTNKKYKHKKRVLLSSVTDPYQYIEKKLELTRKILESFVHENSNLEICILTKSPLICRDIDLLRKLRHTEVGLTITSTKNSVSRTLECNAPSVVKRLETLKTLNKNGINTYAFIGPLLPGDFYENQELDSLFRKIKESGTNEVYIEHLNPNPVSREVIENFYKEKRRNFCLSKKEVDKKVIHLVKKYDLRLRLNEVITHGK